MAAVSCKSSVSTIIIVTPMSKVPMAVVVAPPTVRIVASSVVIYRNDVARIGQDRCRKRGDGHRLRGAGNCHGSHHSERNRTGKSQHVVLPWAGRSLRHGTCRWNVKMEREDGARRKARCRAMAYTSNRSWKRVLQILRVLTQGRTLKRWAMVCQTNNGLNNHHKVVTSGMLPLVSGAASALCLVVGYCREGRR